MIKKYNARVLIEVVLAFYWCIFMTQSDSYYSPYLLVGIVGICCLITNINCEQIRRSKIRVCFIIQIGAVLLSIATVLANYSCFIKILDEQWGIMKLITSAIGVSLGGTILFREILVKISIIKEVTVIDKSNSRQIKWQFVILGVIMAMVYATVLFTSEYPGVLSPDSIWQMSQLLNHSYTNHHPYYHTQLIHIFISLGYWLFGDINKAVAVYSIFSIIVMTFCFCYVVASIYWITNSKKIALGVYFWYLVMPFHIIYSFTMWKDVIFGAAVTLFVVGTYREMLKIKNNIGNLVIIICAAMGTCLLRSNGWVVFLISAVCFVILFGKKEKTIVVLFVFVLVISYILKHPVLQELNVSQPDTIEALSIPTQQVARVIADGKVLTKEQYKLLNQVVDVDRVAENYKSYISDNIKDLVREKNNQGFIDEHKEEYIKLYIQLGIKYPYKYIEAWVDQTKGYWNSGYSYWKWYTGITDNTFGVQRVVFSDQAKQLLEGYLNLWENSLILQLFLSIGLFVWVIAMVLCRSIFLRNRVSLFNTIPFLALIFTLMIATPVYAEFRYAYPLFCGLPFIVITAFVNRKNEY